ncbi:unnamed protein product [Cylindrotheca closterium]|uniref:Pre-mRNA-splicing factor 38 n=1 Tax=Cylindrotheca closterium TaxID=2856 RepID=A0AAD2G4P9_9STRA|nr:unnamed protein product [Cylindrotheca closterium]
MSRSALWRQEGNVKGRQREAEELFQLAVEEGRNTRQKNLLQLWGPDDSFHFNPMLLQNIIQSNYFQKCCRDITDWNMLVDEIYYQVKHLQPWAAGSNKEPSTAFCLLLRLLTLRCTEKQMQLMLDHADSPYIRAIGFLYLRYAGDPKSVWNWIEPYLYDEEPVQVEASASKRKETIGDFVRMLYGSRNNYHGTMLPRLPIQIEREIKVKLLQAEKIEQRAQKHLADRTTMDYFKKLGSKCQALYGDEENPVTWYEAVVDRVITTNEKTMEPLRAPKFVVHFPEYGNTETVELGEMEMPGLNTDDAPVRGGFSERESDRNYSRGRDNRGYHSSDSGKGYNDRDRDGRGYRAQTPNDRGYGGGRGYRGGRDNASRKGDGRWERDSGRDRGGGRTRPGGAGMPSEGDLYEEVRRRERDTVAASSRSQYSRRSQSTKESISKHHYRESERGHAGRAHGAPQRDAQRRSVNESEAPAPKRKSPEEIAAIQAKKRKLMAKYG